MRGFRTYSQKGAELDEEGFPVIRTDNRTFRTGAPQETPAFFDFRCPKKNMSVCRMLRLRGGPADNGDLPAWSWDGNHEKPTMVPSINCLSRNPANHAEKYAGCGWHGWIKAGETVDA